MDKEKSAAEELISLTITEKINIEISIIKRLYKDLIEKYNFELEPIVDMPPIGKAINFSNGCFVVTFKFELTRYNLLESCGVLITVSTTNKIYSLPDVVTILKNDNKFSYSNEFYSIIDPIEAHRLIWDDVIDKTFENCVPTWESDVQAYIDRGRVL